ncbi:MAG: lysine biosynthesis protein LysX [Candidatus Bathyarchaeota archaeon]|nr:lysine biosynthesis protein LysX [Candidatus Bathyarchaeota archaeon]
MQRSLSILYDRVRWEEKTLLEKAKEKRINVKLIDAKSFPINLTNVNSFEDFGDYVIQRCVGYFRGLHLTAILEAKNLSVVNSFQTSLICGNKLLTTLHLAKANIPTPKTYAAFSTESALDALSEIGYPAISKPIIGSWGRLISLIRDRNGAETVLEHREMMNNSLLKIYYIQEMVRRPPRDIRIIVMDENVVTAIYRSSSSNSWRTNVALGAKVSPCRVNDEIRDLAIRASNAVGGGILAVDAMESKEGILVHEINSTIEFKGASSASKVDIAEEILDYVLQKLKR